MRTNSVANYTLSSDTEVAATEMLSPLLDELFRLLETRLSGC